MLRRDAVLVRQTQWQKHVSDKRKNQGVQIKTILLLMGIRKVSGRVDLMHLCNNECHRTGLFKPLPVGG